MNYPKVLQNLIEDFKALPGVGEKTAERYALKILNMKDSDAEVFSADILAVKNNIHRCPVCGNITDEDLCEVCKDTQRNMKQICVVQDSKDIFALDKTSYNGLYHVLNGLISPSKGILPDDINLKSLFDRLDGVEEVIIATNPNMDGETTALYITRILKEKGIKVSRLARGLSMGSQLDYADELTLQQAFEGRRED